VTAPRQRLSARDYKHGRRSDGLDVMQYRQFGAGLAVGLGVALGVWLWGQRPQPEEPAAAPTAAAPEVAPQEETDPADRLDFYDMAPDFEVVVPAEDRRSRGAAQPTARITTPGAYEIQANSFRSRPSAEAQRDRIGKLGIDATIQHVTIDEDEWYRVIIGPTRDLAKLNEIREALRVAQITYRTRLIPE
jgi:cell division protein FtsN